MRGAAALTIRPNSGLLMLPFTAGPVELCMIQRVEGFQAKLQGFGFRQAQIFQKGKVEVLDSRAVEKAPGSGAELTQARQTEECRVERRFTVTWIRINFQIPWSEIRCVHGIIIDPVRNRPEQRSIVVVVQRDGQTRRESHD